MLLLASTSGCSPITALTSSPSAFCDRVPPLPQTPVGDMQRDWGLWLDHVVGNYDCTCPGGKYYGINDKICEGKR